MQKHEDKRSLNVVPWLISEKKNEQKSYLSKNSSPKIKICDIWHWLRSLTFLRCVVSFFETSKINFKNFLQSLNLQFYENYQEIAILWLESVDGDSESSNKVREDFEPKIRENQKSNSILFNFLVLFSFIWYLKNLLRFLGKWNEIEWIQ